MPININHTDNLILSTDSNVSFGMNGSVRIPVGTTAQRPSLPLNGMFRYNENNHVFEGYVSGSWEQLGGSGSGFFKGENGTVGNVSNGAGDIFRVHEQILNTDVTITSTENAAAVGPLTVASGVTLTVAAGGNLAIV